MFIPDAYYQVAKIRHQEMLKEVETYRLYRELQGNQPGLLHRIALQVKAAGQWIKAHMQPNTVEPCFHGS